MKRILILLILLASLTACGSLGEPDPRAQAEADAIRSRAAQDAADRIQARQAPAPVVVQSDNSSLPWVLAYCGVLGMALSFGATAAALGIARATAKGAAQQQMLPPITQTRVIIDRVGRGMYRLTDTSGSRLLDLHDPDDAKLLQEVSR